MKTESFSMQNEISFQVNFSVKNVFMTQKVADNDF